MINPNSLLSRLTELIRSIEPVMAFMYGDDRRVRPYIARYPTDMNIQYAVETMPSPGVLVIWERLARAPVGNMLFRAHCMRIVFRLGAKPIDPTLSSAADTNFDGGNGNLQADFFATLINTRPKDQPVGIEDLEILPGCEILWQPLELWSALDAKGIEYWSIGWNGGPFQVYESEIGSSSVAA